MPICTNTSLLLSAVEATVKDQPRRHRKMLELWVSELEPELGYDSVYAAGHKWSTVHWNGLRGTYSFRRGTGIFGTGGYYR